MGRVGTHKRNIMARRCHGNGQRGTCCRFTHSSLTSANDNLWIIRFRIDIILIKSNQSFKIIVLAFTTLTCAKCLRSKISQGRCTNQFHIIKWHFRHLNNTRIIIIIAINIIAPVLIARGNILARLRQLGYPTLLSGHATVVISFHRLGHLAPRTIVPIRAAVITATADTLVDHQVRHANPLIVQFAHQSLTFPHAQYRGNGNHDKFGRR
mmetsp:Transcript_32812/g.69004  ORF Transcript_32812/g.69004 Transcript_32812/m.69004 type:complete len:210 (+) Transcript_32812:1146-1775(+)